MRVLVAGAGPAGCLAAVLLARRGHEVTLAEQSRFPRDKVCGECLSTLGQDVLHRHNLGGVLVGARPIVRSVVLAHGRRAVADLPRPMAGITRRVMDARLLAAARAAGVEVRQPARVDSLSRLRDLATNAVEPIDHDAIIVADGKGKLAGTAGPATGDMGIKAHFTDVAADPAAVTLIATGDCYGGLAPVGEVWNLAWSVPATLLKQHRGDLDAVLHDLRRRSVDLDASLENATRVGDWQASPLPRFGVASDWPARVWCVGNAAAALEPIGGEGMGLALRSAEIATDAIHAGRGPSAVRTELATLWRTRRVACRSAAVLLTTAPRLAVPLAGVGPVSDLGLRLIGK